jgi:hypothetical protein
MKFYYPYISDKPNKKFFVITKDNKKLYFGQAGTQHFTEGHLDETRRRAYINRHKKNENWNNKDSAGFWSYRYLWLYPSYKEAYENIKNKYL